MARAMALKVAAVVAVAAAVCVAADEAHQVEVDMRALLLTTKPANHSDNAAVLTLLEGTGIPVDVLDVVDDAAVHGGALLDLEHIDSRHGKYYAIFLESRELGYNVGPGTYVSALSADQWRQVDTYCAVYSVRSVALYSWPYFDDVVLATVPAGVKVHLTEAFAAEDPTYRSRANGGAGVNLIHTWSTPADTSRSVTVQAVAGYYTESGGVSTRHGDAMAVQTLQSGAERLHYFFVPSQWHASQLAVLHVGIQWAVKGLYLGERRFNLAMQIDDLFLESPEWTLDIATTFDDTDPGYRITAQDMADLRDFQTQLTSELPAGSDIKYEWALNGLGVIEAGGIASDPLAQQAITDANEFYWLTHTYNHPNLNDLDYDTCKAEIADNKAFVNQLWGTLPDTWGPADLVPPSISGLFNGPCLRALQSEGIVTEVGDNSRPELLPETYGGSPFHGLWTTDAVNGQTGTFIIPRFATNIFYNNADPQNNLDHFNYMTGLGWTMDELLDYEADTVTRWFLKQRRDPYMFHQANAKFAAYPGWTYNGGKASLLSLWAKRVIDHVMQYVDAPVVTWRQSEMRTRLLARMTRDACNIDAKLVVQNGVAVEVVAEAGATCTMALTGARAEAVSAFTTEQYGDELTTYVPLTHASGAIAIPTGLTAPPVVCDPTCSEHGTCDTSKNPAACVCDLGWGGLDCGTAATAWGGNWLVNPGFENLYNDGSVNHAEGWSDFVSGPLIVGQARTGAYAVHFHAADSMLQMGSYQYVPLNQISATPLRLSGYAKGTNVGGIKDGHFALYMDVAYTDGTWQYGTVAPFETGTTDFQYSETEFIPSKPVASAFVYTMFRYHSGTAVFDDVSLQMEVPPEGGSVSTDGRCGFNSPLNAVCATGACCSQQGWCQASCDDVPPPTFNECVNCYGATSGPCKTADGACWSLLDGACPAGSVACDEVPALDEDDSHVVTADFTLTGINEAALSDDLQSIVEDAVETESGADSGTKSGASVTDVSNGAGANTASARRRRLAESDVGAEGGSGLESATCTVTGRDAESVRVRVIVGTSADGPTADQMAADLKQSIDNGDFDATLQQQGLGVETSLIGDVRVVASQQSQAPNAGVSTGFLIGACLTGLAVGVMIGVLAALAMRRDPSTTVTSVDKRVVHKSDSHQRIELPKIGAARRSDTGAYDALGTQQGEGGKLLAARRHTEEEPEVIGTVTPRTSDA